MTAARAIAAYWVATFHGELSDTELVLFDRHLADTDPQDAREAIDGVAATGAFPPTAQRIAELAQEVRRNRVRFARLELPGPAEGHVSFAEFLRDNPATAEWVKELTTKKDGNGIVEALAWILERGL